jgi:molybdate transport system substrate-binding protein
LVACLISGSQAESAELIVASAISLQAPLTELGRRFEARHPDTRIRFSFGASSAMAAQVRAGAPIDVLVSAADGIVTALAAEGIVDGESRRAVAGNQLVVIVADTFLAATDGRGIDGPRDLLAPEVGRIAIPAAAVPVGDYARRWLRDQGLLDALAARIVPTQHARATLAAVDGGHVDAGIVYVTDARLAKSARVAFEIAAADQPDIRYSAVVVSNSHDPTRAADLIASLTNVEAARVFLAAGFTAP